MRPPLHVGTHMHTWAHTHTQAHAQPWDFAVETGWKDVRIRRRGAAHRHPGCGHHPQHGAGVPALAGVPPARHGRHLRSGTLTSVAQSTLVLAAIRGFLFPLAAPETKTPHLQGSWAQRPWGEADMNSHSPMARAASCSYHRGSQPIPHGPASSLLGICGVPSFSWGPSVPSPSLDATS